MPPSYLGGSMSTFAKIISELKATHGYVEGINGWHNQLSNPYEKGSKAFKEWNIGYEDAKFVDEMLDEYKLEKDR